jgi:hypothetical protein
VGALTHGGGGQQRARRSAFGRRGQGGQNSFRSRPTMRASSSSDGGPSGV